MKGKLVGVGSIVVGAAVFAVLLMQEGFQDGFIAFILNCIGLAMIGLIILGIMLLVWA